jgi:formamidopyrimidine-DNA glycosylase
MLNPYILIIAIVDIKYDDPIVFKDTSAKDFATSLKGKKVVGAKRWGKYFWYSNIVTLYLLRIEMESPPHPVLHFGMHVMNDDL